MEGDYHSPHMSFLQGFLFVLCLVLSAAWLYCVHRMSHALRDRHPEVYEELELEDMWPKDLAGWFRTHNNWGPVRRLLGFLFPPRFEKLDDPEITTLGLRMRKVLVADLVAFVTLFVWFLVEEPHGEDDVVAAAASAAEAPAAAQGPSVADKLRSRALAAWRRNDLEAALADFRAVIDLEPADFEVHRHADRILSSQRRYDEAIALWNEYLKWSPRDAEAYFERGGAHYRKQDFPAARADAQRACELGKEQACPMVERLKDK